MNVQTKFKKEYVIFQEKNIPLFKRFNKTTFQKIFEIIFKNKFISYLYIIRNFLPKSIHLYPEKDVYFAVYVQNLHVHIHVHQIHRSDVYFSCVCTRNTRKLRVFLTCIYTDYTGLTCIKFFFTVFMEQNDFFKQNIIRY